MFDGGAVERTERERIEQADRALVVGLGATGLSVARWLTARGVSVAITDSRDRPPRLDELKAMLPDVAMFLGGFSRQALQHADMVVLSPGVSRDESLVQEALAAGLPVVGDVELFALSARAPVVAVTGSNGKSTVATVVAMIAERDGRRVGAGGNLGTPALDLLTEPEPELYVLELSSFQLESTTHLAPVAAAVLNLSVDHMDRYAGLGPYAAAKARIFHGDGVVVVNRDEEAVASLAPAGRRVTSFGAGAPAGDGEYGLRERDGDTWLVRGGDWLMPERGLAMIGRHNTLNALAAFALAEAAGLSREATIAVLGEFRGLPHRMELVAESGGLRWVNDSKATNIGATLAAIEGSAGDLVVILGGDGKGQDFALLVPTLARRVRAAVVLGKDRERIVAAIGDTVPVHVVDDMNKAVRTAASAAQPGDTVLLSPACSSLDMFSGFDARGRAFAEAVRALS